tara:strand:- start:283 stop:453 length:171 start_codon:yes stop_codon:yes gene_type:complete
MNERKEEQWMSVEIAMHIIDAMVDSLASNTSALNQSERDILLSAWTTIKYKMDGAV